MLAFIVAPAHAQPPAGDAAVPNQRLAVLEAEEQVLAARTGGDATAIGQAEDHLVSACETFGYPDIETCLSIARNEKWIPTGTRGCVITAGRAWGCEPGAFGKPPATQQ